MLGLSFESYVVEINDGEREDFIFRNFKYEKIEFIEDGIGRFMNENKDFVNELTAIYQKHHFELKK